VEEIMITSTLPSKNRRNGNRAGKVKEWVGDAAALLALSNSIENLRAPLPSGPIAILFL